MKKILIVGCSCTGKTSTGHLIESRLGIPFFDLDDMFWNPNWEGTEDDKFREKVNQITSKDSWCISGNYNRVKDLTWSNADAVIWLNYPFPVIVRQAFYRTFKRVFTKELVCNGNTESFFKSFFTRESILLWVYQSYPNMLKRYDLRKNNPIYDSYQFFVFFDHYEVRNWIEKLRK